VIVHTYVGWSDYDFKAALNEALPTTPKQDDFGEATAVYWLGFNRD
jgi:hypothetical protein